MSVERSKALEQHACAWIRADGRAGDDDGDESFNTSRWRVAASVVGRRSAISTMLCRRSNISTVCGAYWEKRASDPAVGEEMNGKVNAPDRVVAGHVVILPTIPAGSMRRRHAVWHASLRIRFVCRGGACGPSSETPNLVGRWSDIASQNLNPGQDSTRRTDDTGGHNTRNSSPGPQNHHCQNARAATAAPASHAPARLGAALNDQCNGQ